MKSSVLPVPRSDFIGLETIAHLAAAGESPVLASQSKIFEQYAQDKARGLEGIISIYSRVEQARQSIARFLNVTPSEIGFGLNVAQVISSIARTLDDPNGNVVLCQWEFTSAMSPWITGSRLDVRLLRAADYLVDSQQLSQLVDTNTRAIVISLVSYYTGQRTDIIELRRIADEVGAVLIIDASHAFGAIQFDLTQADFVVSCAYKWLLGVHGAAIAYCNAERQPTWSPLESGWRSTREVDAVERGTTVLRENDGRRFELGNPAVLSVLFTGEGVRYLNEVGATRIERHLTELTGAILSRLDSLDLDILTPRKDTERAGIVSFRVRNSSLWKAKLKEEGILAWVTEGRVRLSPHIFTSQDDVARALDAISRVANFRSGTRDLATNVSI